MNFSFLFENLMAFFIFKRNIKKYEIKNRLYGLFFAIQFLCKHIRKLFFGLFNRSYAVLGEAFAHRHPEKLIKKTINTSVLNVNEFKLMDKQYSAYWVRTTDLYTLSRRAINFWAILADFSFISWETAKSVLEIFNI